MAAGGMGQTVRIYDPRVSGISKIYEDLHTGNIYYTYLRSRKLMTIFIRLDILYQNEPLWEVSSKRIS